MNHFFSDSKNAYKYPRPKNLFDQAQRQNSIDPTRYFKIATGTHLVSKHIVTKDRTPDGVRYFIKKTYLQLVERNIRTTKRASSRTNHNTPVRTNSSTRYDILQDVKNIEGTSDDDGTGIIVSPPNLSPNDSIVDNDTNKILSITEDKDLEGTIPGNITTTKTSDDDLESVPSDISKHAEELEKSMDHARAALDDVNDSTHVDHINDTIRQLFNVQIQPLLDIVKTKIADLDRSIMRYDAISAKTETLYASIQSSEKDLKHMKQKFDGKINYVNRKSDEFEITLQTYNDKIDTLVDEYKNNCGRITNDFQTKLDTLSKSPVTSDMYSKLESKIKDIRRNQKILSQTQEDDYDLIDDRITRVEKDIRTIRATQKQRPANMPTYDQRILRFDTTSDDFDTDDQIKPVSSVPSRVM